MNIGATKKGWGGEWMGVKAVSLAKKKNPPIKLELYVDRKSPVLKLFTNL
jgi:hypothetical protein